MWIWQQPEWPDFTWNADVIEPLLRKVRLNQGILIGKMLSQPVEEKQRMLDTFLANIVHSSAIEGENINAFSVRSSLAAKLGLNEKTPYPTTAQTDGLAEIIVDAIEEYEKPLTLERILRWHSLLFSGEDNFLHRIEGGVLRGSSPMQVVSGRLEKPVVHFEAPARIHLEPELSGFISWFNESRDASFPDPIIRAAITHFWFVTIHPFEDGNGRITRLLTDLALAQAENQSVRFYAMSVSILKRRASYYDTLERSQKGTMDITDWVKWFLETLDDTFSQVMCDIEQLIFKSRYWRSVDQSVLNPAQVKVLNKMLDGDFADGINTTQYHRVAKVSKPTATRHLAFLVEQGCLVKAGGGRSTRYKLSDKFS